MDDLSQLLRMARLEATLDKRCLLAGSTAMDIDPYGERQVPFHVLLDGECEIELGGRLYPMEAGDVVIIPSGAQHRIITGGRRAAVGTLRRDQASYELITSDRAGDEVPVIDLFCGHYTVGAGAGSILFGSLPTPTQASLFGSEDGRSTLGLLSSLMRAEAANDGRGSSAIMSALCTVLAALVLRTGPDAGGRTRLWTAVPDQRLNRVIQDVIARPGEDWSIERITAMTLVSRATFFRRFQAGTGLTFGQFLTRARLMRAADLLTNGDAAVGEVATEVGYRSESAFTRAFRELLGETPARFRKSAAKQPTG
jgi:AraC-like DNA-binding protein